MSEFDELKQLAIEAGLSADGLESVDSGDISLQQTTSTEIQLSRLMHKRARQDGAALNFLGAGPSDYFLPAIARQTQSNSTQTAESIERISSFLGELTAMPHCDLNGDDVVTRLAHLLSSSSSRMSAPERTSGDKVLLAASLPPMVRQALQTQLKVRRVDAEVIGFDPASGCIAAQQLQQLDAEQISACVIAWPNFFGVAESLQTLSAWARANRIVLIAVVNPLLLSFLRSPAELPGGAVDYLVGDCQALGLPLNRYGCAPTFVAAQSTELPLSDADSVPLAASDALAMANYLDAMGSDGMRAGVAQGHHRLAALLDGLLDIPGVEIAFASPRVNECVIRLANIDLDKATRILTGHNISPGFPLGEDYPELHDCLLIHANDQHDDSDVDKFAAKLKTVVNNLGRAACPVKPKF